jgi:two-component system response regulator DevR
MLPDASAGARRQHPVRVLVCEEHDDVRDGLRVVLGRHRALNVVASAATGAEAVDAAVRLRPDIVVMDVRLSGGRGIELCGVIRQILPATKVVMLTHYPGDRSLHDAIVAGASAYVVKATPSQRLVNAIEEVAKGRSFFDFAVATAALDRLRRRD